MSIKITKSYNLPEHMKSEAEKKKPHTHVIFSSDDEEYTVLTFDFKTSKAEGHVPISIQNLIEIITTDFTKQKDVTTFGPFNKNLLPITTLFDRIIVLEEELGSLNKGGIELPEDLDNTPRYGKVMVAGMEAKWCKPGDMILWRQGAGDEIYMENIRYLIMNEKDVIAIIEKKEQNLSGEEETTG